MSIFPYTDLAASLSEVKSNPATKGRIPATEDTRLTNLLIASAGIAPGAITTYRPYYVAALSLQQDASLHQLKQAPDGVQFTGLAVPIASLLQQQAMFDRMYELKLKPGMELPLFTEAIAPTAPTQPRRLGTRSFYAPTLP